MLSKDEIQKRLADRRISVVALRTGLSYPTIKRVADGGSDVRLSTIQRLSDYFEGKIK